MGRFALIDRQLVVLVINAVSGRGAGGVDFIPAGVERQLFRHIFLFKSVDGVQRFAVLDLFGFYLIVKIGLLKQRITLQRLLEFLLEF